jgi:hypothetical protein
VRRIVYLGGLIPQNPESVHLQSRYETGEVLREGAVPVTEVRAGMIIGPGSAAFEVMRDHNVPAHWVEGSIRCRNFEPKYAYYAKQATGSCMTSADPREMCQRDGWLRLNSAEH